MKHLDWYMTMKKTSDKRNAKYYAAWLVRYFEGKAGISRLVCCCFAVWSCKAKV